VIGWTHKTQSAEVRV